MRAARPRSIRRDGRARTRPRNSLLSCFHYLSTVSGGGYIGSWLSAWRQRNDFETVWKYLAGRPEGPDVEPPEISWLRAYSNYLTPKIGLGLRRHLDRHRDLPAQSDPQLAGDRAGARRRDPGAEGHHHAVGRRGAHRERLVAAIRRHADRRGLTDRGAGLHHRAPADAPAAARGGHRARSEQYRPDRIHPATICLEPRLGDPDHQRAHVLDRHGAGRAAISAHSARSASAPSWVC